MSFSGYCGNGRPPGVVPVGYQNSGRPQTATSSYAKTIKRNTTVGMAVLHVFGEPFYHQEVRKLYDTFRVFSRDVTVDDKVAEEAIPSLQRLAMSEDSRYGWVVQHINIILKIKRIDRSVKLQKRRERQKLASTVTPRTPDAVVVAAFPPMEHTPDFPGARPVRESKEKAKEEIKAARKKEQVTNKEFFRDIEDEMSEESDVDSDPEDNRRSNAPQ
jgi:hypothetical protein